MSQLPNNFDIESISEKFPPVYEESMNTVLTQEAIRYNKLIEVVRTTLQHLQKALRGQMLMTEQLDAIATSLLQQTVPAYWANFAYPSLMPLGSWLKDLFQRIEFITNWVQCGIPNVFWISGFFFPQAFLTGTLQNYARKYKKSIDKISFTYQVRDEFSLDSLHTIPKPDDGVYIHGLFMQGARWDDQLHSISECRPRELFAAFPVIYLLPHEEVLSETSDAVSNAVAPTYKCPVYKTLTRAGTLSTTGHSTNFVCFVDIPSQVVPTTWIKAGVALFCALNY
jgi:dynein heavy chain